MFISLYIYILIKCLIGILYRMLVPGYTLNPVLSTKNIQDCQIMIHDHDMKNETKHINDAIGKSLNEWKLWNDE